MSLSKPIYSLVGIYLEQLFNHPVRTKSITSSILAGSANYTAQRIAGQKVNQESVIAYSLFGLIFGGTVPHYFYRTVERLFNHDMKFRRFFQFLSERLVFAPFYQLLSLYFLSIFEMNSHEVAVANLKKLYWPLLRTNWQYLSIPVFLNMAFVPPMLRTVTMSIVSFIWVVYMARRRRRLQEKSTGDSDKKGNQ
ncbi:peroxisomal membrane protein 2 [Anastrepha obliqua]|uniref:peroxisomal membrane protein 2 n=1 Tax=Anastrepha obliqua TaxID=95512 RepID=UPI0024093E6D|nr:peroxisomal membrane protein 2 [Anastrepha obliqua]XP_054735325.1 peroxisomal membrane protein 2 [Anastrepha obliqua]XP_054735326.1 peroxisomal membrane protein 2 [Anastrepha obliqua]XP_054735327.1 peroxisomal membrane protein 2 [Anastrepha obliqua]XP_054735328.1 peroxisomal membrane protein 2 [Anastrepha obliqua]XP_054735329.1 peroxisomal membrane protein 2 [Anastrepha obliqua]XP_054735330.1 peroxisomal membrane protein 2 [Anastrepha obliqua]XP_054735331.1 peroxisomal membrane protein 2 